MVEQTYTLLWNKIQDFPIDETAAAVPFSAKLAAAQKWTAAYAQRAIEEYRKFLLLCCVLENGAAPSKAVDEVWHLHLTYTRSYWTDLCRDTLGKDIHHYPSTGGETEDDKHRLWYTDTLRSYREIFGEEAPVDIWPVAAVGRSAEIERGHAGETRRIGDSPFVWNGGTVAVVVVALLPFLFIAVNYHTLSPFTLGGPHFLVFFPLFGIAMILGFVLYRREAGRQIEAIVQANLSDAVTPFQLAAFLYDKHRALQAGIVDLVKRGLLEVSDNTLIVRKEIYEPQTGETNPLIPAFEEAEDGSSLRYEELMVNWYDRSKFSHPSLDLLSEFANRAEPLFPTYVLPLIFLVVAAVRIVQGVYNDRPVGALIAEIVFISIPFVITTVLLSRKKQVQQKVNKLFKVHLQTNTGSNDPMVGAYALQGMPAMSGFAEVAMLTAVFGVYGSSNGGSSWGSSSGDSGSSDGGGSSCSGGSSCGSSCGGCSGGD